MRRACPLPRTGVSGPRRHVLFYFRTSTFSIVEADMKPGNALLWGLALCFIVSVYSHGQTDPKPWEQYGISQTEWKIIQDKNISIEKLKEILAAGISVSEYAEQPWKNLSLSEHAWITKRRNGMTSYDIEVEQQIKQREWKGDNRGTMQAEIGAFSGNRDLVLSFVLPGYEQLRHGQKVRGRVMSGLAVGALAACVIGSFAQGYFEGIPLYFVLVPDMFWSMIDFKITAAKLANE
jgi:hypothetical protein